MYIRFLGVSNFCSEIFMVLKQFSKVENVNLAVLLLLGTFFKFEVKIKNNKNKKVYFTIRSLINKISELKPFSFKCYLYLPN
jgi:hypothetical protein